MTRTPTRISTGISGLDDVLHGGVIPRRSYLVRGDPGTGKTILGMNYLTAGVDRGETVLFINLEEAEEEVQKNAAAIGIDLSDVHFLDLSPDSDVFVNDRSYDIFTPNEVEQESFTRRITRRIESLSPDRVFVDPITNLRHLTSDEYQFKKQVIGFTTHLKEQGATVLCTSQHSRESSDADLQYVTDGTIELEQASVGRTLTVPKFRGSAIREGDHTMRIGRGGVTVYPELSVDSNGRSSIDDPLPSGVPAVDELLHGGLERGTVTLLSGPTGAGKTTAGTRFVKEAAGRSERSVVYLFEETRATFFERNQSISIPVERMESEGILSVEEVDPLGLSVVQFAQQVRNEAAENDTSIVMIDGLDGYELSLRDGEDELVDRLHTLCRSLTDAGVTVILVEETDDVTGTFSATDSGISHLADNIVFLRHLEFQGEMRKAIGVLKKRASDFERTLREFRITDRGIEVGEPLTDLRGVLSGSPRWDESSRPLDSEATETE